MIRPINKGLYLLKERIVKKYISVNSWQLLRWSRN